MISPDQLRGLVAEVLPTVTELRRAIHRQPELSFHELATTRRVAELVSAAGLAPSVRPDGTGLTCQVGNSGPLVGFRADLDALPISEPPTSPFTSEVPGVMHACGHDAHTAIAAGIALVLSRGDLPGRVRFIFQPGEESFPGGAIEMVREGAAAGLSGIVAFHVDPTLVRGSVGFRSGPVTGSADRFTIRLEGPGGHTARPHRTVDLVYAAGRIMTDLPALVGRQVDPRRPVAVVFGRVSGGTVDNVIPTLIELGGTARTTDRELWDEMPALIDRLAHEIVAPTGAKVTVEYVLGIPPVVNDAAVVAAARAGVVEALGPSAAAATETSMGAEDFSRYLDHAPGALLRLGMADGRSMVDLHSAGFVFDDATLEPGIIAGSAILLAMMRDL